MWPKLMDTKCWGIGIHLVCTWLQGLSPLLPRSQSIPRDIDASADGFGRQQGHPEDWHLDKAELEGPAVITLFVLFF